MNSVSTAYKANHGITDLSAVLGFKYSRTSRGLQLLKWQDVSDFFLTLNCGNFGQLLPQPKDRASRTKVLGKP